MFDGNVYGGRVDLSGQGHSRNRARGAAEESRREFVKRQHRERETRERKRSQEKAATTIQAFFRWYRSVRAVQAEHRQLFDKKHAGLVKASAMLPLDKRAKFVSLTLKSLLRIFVFSFEKHQDGGRLESMLKLIRFSSEQPPTYNILHLVRAVKEERWCFLVLYKRFLDALLGLGRTGDATSLLLLLQAVLSEGSGTISQDGDANNILGYLLLHSEALIVLARDALPLALGSEQQAIGQASPANLLSLCCTGLEVCPSSKQEFLLLCFLTAPRLGNFLVRSKTDVCRVTAMLDHSRSSLHNQEQCNTLLVEPIEGKSRCCWLIDNLVSVLEKGLTLGLGRNVSGLENLSPWLDWLCLAKGQRAVFDESAAQQFLRIYNTNFSRSLLNATTKHSADDLLTLCRLYFSEDGEGELEPPPELLQTFGFATPLAERLFHVLSRLIHNPYVEDVFRTLRPPEFKGPEALQLRVFCTVYALKLKPMYDDEFFSSANSLSIDEVRALANFLNRLVYHFIINIPDKSCLAPVAKSLRTSLVMLLHSLYNRHQRKAILLDDDAWVIPSSKILLRRAPALKEIREGEQTGMDVEEPGWDERAQASSRKMAESLPGEALDAVLEEVPHVLPFEDRVSLLHQVIRADQEKRREGRWHWSMMSDRRHRIRRSHLLSDGYKAFDELQGECELRDVFRVEFIAPDGSPEVGVDGGGLFKEFMIHVCRGIFDPECGLFSVTQEQTLYPNASSVYLHENALNYYVFIGKVIGKAIYEMILLESQFSRVFLNRLLGRLNELDDIAALDQELHRNMNLLKQCENVEDLGLTFSVSASDLRYQDEIDLIPHGRNVPVTNENLTRYFHLMANYKTNVQVQRHTEAFLKGIQAVIPLRWLKMFDPYELNILISGSCSGFDVEDLHRHTVYSGGFREDSPVIVWLWTLLHHHFDANDLGLFLMFSTSCSRAPLLGFGTLYPQFCIHRVPDRDRLPTASTCANMLKLPDYDTFDLLRSKVIQAIRAEAGFHLS